MFTLSFLLYSTGVKPVLLMVAHCLLVYACCFIFKSIIAVWICCLGIVLSLQINAAKIWQVRHWLQWSVERFSIACRRYSLNYFGFALLRSVIGLKNSRHPLNQSDAKQKTNHDLVTRVFPRFPALSACYVYLFRALIGSLHFLRLLWLAIIVIAFSLVLYDTQLKTALLLI